MDTFRELVAVAAAEMRSSRRLVRTWLFIVLSVLIGLAFYFYYAVIHGIFSNQSATIGLVHARFLMSGIGIFVIGVFMIAIVFLAFDVRARGRPGADGRGVGLAPDQQCHVNGRSFAWRCLDRLAATGLSDGAHPRHR